MTPEVVQSTAYSSSFPASSVLILYEEDAKMANGKYNYWAGEKGKTIGQGFTLRLDERNCKRLIAGFQIKPMGKGVNRWGATKEFRVSGSKNENGPWQTFVEGHLNDTMGKAAPLLNFNFEEPAEIQFIKFDLVSFWGAGGAIQYFAAVPEFPAIPVTGISPMTALQGRQLGCKLWLPLANAKAHIAKTPPPP